MADGAIARGENTQRHKEDGHMTKEAGTRETHLQTKKYQGLSTRSREDWGKDHALQPLKAARPY